MISQLSFSQKFPSNYFLVLATVSKNNSFTDFSQLLSIFKMSEAYLEPNQTSKMKPSEAVVQSYSVKSRS